MQAFSPLKKDFEDFLFAQYFNRKPQSLYQPFSYMFELGGKRIRPVLLLAANECLGGDKQKALPIAMAIELFHNFSLIHDDIMDEADIRRGQKTVHKKYGSNTAILSGDVMFVYAYEYLSQSSNPKITELFNLTAKQVCEGQQYDMEFETRFDVSPEQYIEMITLKTAVLLGCSLQIGTILAGANESIQKEFYSFGMNLGISFQIKDDILDTYANQADFGKQIGGDILQNKRTYLLLHCLQESNSNDRDEMLKLLQNTDLSKETKIEKVKHLYSQSNTRLAAENEAERYYQLSLENLQSIKAQGIDCELLENFAAQLLKREI